MDSGALAAGLIFFLILGLYFLPTIVAARRYHHRTSQIFIVNLFLGWTFLGWVVALVMAVGPGVTGVRR